jgi:prophage tail gpP-like protein
MSSPTSISQAPDITITIDGERLSGFEGLSIIRALDSAADAFSFSIPWGPTPENRRRFAPFATRTIDIDVGARRILRGYIEQVNVSTSTGGRQLNIQGRSETGVLVDWSVGPPFEWEGVSFNDIAAQIAHPYRVYAPTNPDLSSQGSIDADTQAALSVVGYGEFALPLIEAEVGQSVFDFLNKLAAANGLWARPIADATAGSELQFTRLSSRAPSIADLVEGESPVMDVSVSHDVTKRFAEYLAISQSDAEQQEATVPDPLGLDRTVRFRRVHQVTQRTTDIEQAAIRARSQAIIDSYSPSVTVSGWTFGGAFWGPGGIVRVVAPGAMIYEPTRLIIKRATMKLSQRAGQTTDLDLTLPEAYDQQQPEARPWAG